MTNQSNSDCDEVLAELKRRRNQLGKLDMQGESGYKPAIRMYARAVKTIEELAARVSELESQIQDLKFENTNLRVNGP